VPPPCPAPVGLDRSRDPGRRAGLLGREDDASGPLWEPEHGEVIARARSSYGHQDPGSRAYASAGLTGAEWWVAGSAGGAPHRADVELADVDALYAEDDLWSAVFAPTT
jgi:hypothetical protein